MPRKNHAVFSPAFRVLPRGNVGVKNQRATVLVRNPLLFRLRGLDLDIHGQELSVPSRLTADPGWELLYAPESPGHLRG